MFAIYCSIERPMFMLLYLLLATTTMTMLMTATVNTMCILWQNQKKREKMVGRHKNNSEKIITVINNKCSIADKSVSRFANNNVCFYVLSKQRAIQCIYTRGKKKAINNYFLSIE